MAHEGLLKPHNTFKTLSFFTDLLYFIIHLFSLLLLNLLNPLLYTRHFQFFQIKLILLLLKRQLHYLSLLLLFINLLLNLPPLLLNTLLPFFLLYY